ncbi:hypothetical protein TI04_06945, partial [Achromatium sp. WMS2]
TKFYADLQAAGFEVLLDDRDVRPGIMFADQELIGIPQRLVLSEKSLDAGTIEYRARNAKDNQFIPISNLLNFLTQTLRSGSSTSNYN